MPCTILPRVAPAAIRCDDEAHVCRNIYSAGRTARWPARALVYCFGHYSSRFRPWGNAFNNIIDFSNASHAFLSQKADGFLLMMILPYIYQNFYPKRLYIRSYIRYLLAGSCFSFDFFFLLQFLPHGSSLAGFLLQSRITFTAYKDKCIITLKSIISNKTLIALLIGRYSTTSRCHRRIYF